MMIGGMVGKEDEREQLHSGLHAWRLIPKGKRYNHGRV